MTNKATARANKARAGQNKKRGKNNGNHYQRIYGILS